MKKMLAILLALLMIMGLSFAVFAADEQKTEGEKKVEIEQKAKDFELRGMLNKLHDEIAKDANDGLIDNDELLRIIAMTNEFPAAKNEADRYLYLFSTKSTVEIPQALTNLAVDYSYMLFNWQDADASFQKFIFKEVGKVCEIQPVRKNKIFAGILFVIFFLGMMTLLVSEEIEALKKFSKLAKLCMAVPVIFFLIGWGQKFYLMWTTYDKFGNWIW